ncbi:hypothetical protein NA57DRAFT_39777 [Rhizodiscina lignyota]|uniref:C2H2-type domain-containing protein n=1 Tax=Rhizodiscina lignyota TaxID=1504668 RepID=A0A9P4M5P1_9PEZI|nr:hypothetical protein NA57DRAFT_39777 [Rhizodiscina lignyota]
MDQAAGTSTPDDQRGRRRTRENEDGEEEMDQGGPEGTSMGSSKKRRRSRKGLDKKFECPHEGCGKSYSRAEHLYRHQLNHNPKQIYRCDFPDCQRSFVRQDLCARHKERHTARGSQLLRKDNFMQNPNPIVTAALNQQNALRMGPSNSPTQPPPDRAFSTQSPMSGVTNSSNRSEASPPLDPTLQSPGSDVQMGTSLNRTASTDSYRTSESNRPQQNYPNLARQSSFGPQGGRPGPDGSFTRQNTMASNMQSLSINGSPYTAAGMQIDQGQSDMRMSAATEAQILESMTPQYSVPMFGGEGISRSPFAMADDFTAWLFNDSQFGSGASPMAYSAHMNNMMAQSQNMGLQAPYFNYDPQVSGNFSQPMPPQHPMAVNSILDANLPESSLSEDRRQHILEHLEMRFNDVTHLTSIKKDELLDGAKRDDHHLLGLSMMQNYITSYWIHFHPQMPILHRPTFSANHCPELLLIAVMAIGASCLERTHGFSTTQQCSELANFFACNIRWEIFQDADFRPPAKLWVFQSLILLEIFEKMYATRPLHERAHIHHATTLTLMRRGSSLIGRSSIDSPPSVKDSRHNSVGINGTLGSGATTPDDWWNHWISNEATRRVAFAAFVMDSIHATMFGHSAVMVAHEMRLPLPCDEAMWSATSSAEVGRAEQLNHQNGVKSPSFLDGLKKTLNGQPVRTNAFGRTILMAGLLSVSWHMNQRDLQVSSLGVTQALGGRDKWRGSLTRAFDFWKIDFDDSLKNNPSALQRTSSHGRTSHPDLDPDNIFEGRTVLHHLAHMAMHVDIVDCQIFAGAHRLLGRSITSQDSAGAQRRMKEVWAPTARARDATFYALRFLSQVLLPDGEAGLRPEQQSSTGLEQHGFTYSARDDFLLNRPWVLYFATLIVWSYGFALDGPLSPVYTLNSDEERVRDMQLFLQRVGGVKSPEDLSRTPHRNACLGLLVLLRDMFLNTRWELLHEAASRLGDCVDMLTGVHQGRESSHGHRESTIVGLGERLGSAAVH